MALRMNGMIFPIHVGALFQKVTEASFSIDIPNAYITKVTLAIIKANCTFNAMCLNVCSLNTLMILKIAARVNVMAPINPIPINIHNALDVVIKNLN
jgi:hypothetical protein